MSQTVYTVTSGAPVKIASGRSDGYSPRVVVSTANDAVNTDVAYVGDSSVTTSDGIPLAERTPVEFPVPEGGLYATTSAATSVEVRVFAP